MKIKFAHLSEQGFNCAIFDANAANNTDSSRADLLGDLVLNARQTGLRVDKAVLAFSRFGRPHFYGDKDLVRFLVSLLENGGNFSWTHELSLNP